MRVNKKEVEALAEAYVSKWLVSLRAQGKKPSKEGIKRYRAVAMRLAFIKLSWNELAKEMENTSNYANGVKEPK